MIMLKHNLVIFLLLSGGWSIEYTNGVLDVELVNEGGITVSFQDMILFCHSKESPLFFVGQGSTDWDENQGNVIVTDTEKVKTPLTNLMNVTLSNDLLSLSLKFSDVNDTVEVTLVMNITHTDATNDDAFLNFYVTRHVNNDDKYNRIHMSVVADPFDEERVYGGGEQYTYLNLRGYDFPIYTREQGVGRDGGLIATGADQSIPGSGGSYDTTYWPQSSYTAIKNSGDRYTMIIDSERYLVLNFTQESCHEIFVHAGSSLSGRILYSKSIKRIVSAFSEVVGRQPMLPDWIMKGAILGVQNGQEEVQLHYNMAKAAEVDISALWIQDWAGTIETNFGHRVYWNWQWNQTYYPDFQTLIAELADDGVYMTVYCNMHLIEGSSFFIEAKNNNAFMTDKDGEIFLQDFGGFNAATIDLLDEDSRNWYADQLRANMIDGQDALGIKGWMADFGEYTLHEMYSKNDIYNSKREAQHNALPVAWAQTNRKILEDTNTTGDTVFWTRAGGLGAGKYTTLAWNGDQNVDYSKGDGLPSTIVATLNLAMSGVGLCHFDIGGYTTLAGDGPLSVGVTRSRELLLRSAEYAVFTPVMRTHEGNMPDANEQFYSSTETIVAFARLTQMHSALFDYTKEQVRQNAENGIPVQRPMFYDFENDPSALDVMYQYMYGPDLIVAPVIEKDQTIVTVFIPGGDDSSWKHLWGGLGGHAGPFEGPLYVNITAPMGLPAVLYRNGSDYELLFLEIQQEFGASAP